MPAVLLVGWVNPMFLIATILVFLRRKSRLLSTLRIATTVSLLASGAVFHYNGLRPREGFFVWVAGIALVLYGDHLTHHLGPIRTQQTPAS